MSVLEVGGKVVNVGGGAVTFGSASTVPNITALPNTFPAANTTAYNALNVPSMTAGTSFYDPSISSPNIVTWKITDASTPAVGHWTPWYSQMGLAISLPWDGGNGVLDQYHLIMCSSETGHGGTYICDFGLSSSATHNGPYNYRAAPSSTNYISGTACFSRKANNPHTLYTVTGGKIRLVNVVTGAYLDTSLGSAAAYGYSANWPAGGWPFETLSSGQWFGVNDTETWATANNGGAAPMYAINLDTGTIITWSPSGVDDTYTCAAAGGGNFTTGDQQSQLWNLDTNAQISFSTSLGFTSSHMAAMRGYYACFDSSGSGSLPFPAAIIQQNTSATTVVGTQSVTPYLAKGSNTAFHTCGYWWLQPATTGQYMLVAIAGVQGGSWPASESYAINFVNPWGSNSPNTNTYRLGFSYCNNIGTIPGNSSSSYYTQAWGHLSHDGKVVIFGSEMLAGARIDLFAMEVPVTSGTPPSFP